MGSGLADHSQRIIVGVKYCFRYNARQRALRNGAGEEADPINLENMPARPHRRRREKKLMTMDEVNERFPLTQYKNWAANRASAGLSTNGGVTVAEPPSRAPSLREVDSSPTDAKNPDHHVSETIQSEEATSTAKNDIGEHFAERKSMEGTTSEKKTPHTLVEEHHSLEEIQTADSAGDKHAPPVVDGDGDDDDDDDEHIHTAVPPELMTNPGDTCAICIDTLEPDDDIRGLTCGHAFHAGCIDPWLTCRRACCPLCKADYYIPKPRPEREAAETERTGRRSGRAPPPPQTAWTGIRGNPRLILPGRFISGYPGDGYDYGRRETRHARRDRRAAAAAQAHRTAANARPVENSRAAAPRRWVPRVSNPFSSMRMPNIPFPGRARGRDTAAEGNATEPSPSQLEAGVVR